LSDDGPAHRFLSAVGFGCSVAAATSLLPADHPFQRDPLTLVLIGIAGVVAGGMLLYALPWRAVAMATSILLAACFAAIRVRVDRGTWSGLPLPLLPLTALAITSWIPRSRRRAAGQPPTWDDWAPIRRSPEGGWERLGDPPGWYRVPGGSPMRVTGMLGDRWALLGGQRLPDADPGGHSRVCLVLDTRRAGRLAVAKLPSREHVRQSAARLVREAELLRACGASRHVVTLLDSGIDVQSGSPFVIVALYRYGSLARLLSAVSGFPLGWAVAITEAILRGLVDLQEHAGRPIAHRDLNPRNVLLASDPATEPHPAVVLCDLGMARRVQAGAGRHDAVTVGPVYSPWYGAPELVRDWPNWGLEVDTYGVGSILYEFVTGQPPLRRESVRFGRSFTALVHGGVRPASAGAMNRWLPDGIVDLLDRCLATRPGDRPSTAREVLARLQWASRGVEELPIPFADLRRRGLTRLRSA
jgi:serine/threonine-protein kinase